ncbi:hypothetical protein NEOLEDRAFT_1173262 [Neolentinus lepideus HHB14362 ss-1]|uniref:C2H2-type domain-containing protein n=1 Tax=Neolentinus lepideus HHB14362 ss-1 TaxID=1314782 RepID=A0A165N0K0_9AGAM|nr:hypothetical protein NEOLEDRAFT_1173262 [Neolentinus lepideus HHB14362 ss-1]
MPKASTNAITPSASVPNYPLPYKLRTWHCDECGRTFSRSQSLTRHQQIHLPEEKRNWIECPVSDCKFKCLQKGNLENHIHSMHTLEPLAVCNDCGREFRDRSCLSRHRKRKHGPKTSSRYIDSMVDLQSMLRSDSHWPRQHSPTSSDDSHLWSARSTPFCTFEAPSFSLPPAPVSETNTVAPALLYGGISHTSWPAFLPYTPAELLDGRAAFDFSMPPPVSTDSSGLFSSEELEVSMGSHLGFDLFDGWDPSDPLFSSVF